MKPKTNAERQAELKARREAQGIVKRAYWATEEEHKHIKRELAKLRGNDL
jgi:hypothetical protein